MVSPLNGGPRTFWALVAILFQKQEVQFSIVVNALQGLILSLKTSSKQKVLGNYNGQDGQLKRK